MSLLEQLFGTVVLPSLVSAELTHPRPRFAPVDISRLDWVRVADPQNRGNVERFERTLDRAEASAIALAIELHADLLLIDEQAGRRVAASMGVPTTGVLGILVRAKARGLIPDLTAHANRLRSELGFHLSDAVLHEARRLAGEA